MTAPGEHWPGPAAVAEPVTPVPPGPVFNEIGFLASGDDEDYEVHCLFEDPVDAQQAADTLNAQQGYDDYRAGTLPVMPVGRLPRRVAVYKVALRERHVYGHRPVLNEASAWEWEVPPLGETDAARLHRGVLAEIIGTDPRIVWMAAQKRSAELHAELRAAANREDTPDV